MAVSQQVSHKPLVDGSAGRDSGLALHRDVGGLVGPRFGSGRARALHTH